MKPKNIIKIIGRLIGRQVIRFCAFVTMFLPEKYIYGFAHIIAKISFAVIGRYRKVAFESLNIAFGKEKSQSEIKQIAIGCFENMAKTAIEFMVFLERPYLVNKYVEVKGIENLNKALTKGNGVIALSAHFGNFPLLLTKLSMDGYKVSSVLRFMRDPWVNDYFEKKREAIGVGSVYTQPRKQCVEKSLEVLRKNEILFIQIDQNFGAGGVFVDFFGKKAATAKGPIVFALRTKAPIVPMFICREKNNTQKLVIEPEVDILQSKDLEETIQSTAQKLSSIIESYARRYPSDWGWVHRRWKARPAEENISTAEELSL